MFLSFEGIDGAGKTTQIEMLQARLETHCDVVATREPGGTRLAETVRAMLLESRDACCDSAELLLFGAARAQHVAEIIRPALERGAWVLCDRFTDSTLAYQGGGLGLDTAFIRQMNGFATGSLQPDATFLLDIAPGDGMERRATRAADRIETRGTEFYERVRRNFQEIAAQEPQRVLCCDATRPAAEIHETIVAHLKDRNLWPQQ